MIVEPDQRVADFAKAGADIISVHVESKATTHLDRVIHQVRVPAGLVGSCDDNLGHRRECTCAFCVQVPHLASCH